MLARFSNALQNAADVLAPPPPLHEDFVYHWKKLMKHYLDVTNSKSVPIETTNIPARLDQLLKILVKEDGEMHVVGHPGPCLEYFLQHGLLNLLATLASSDQPPGIRQCILHFVTKFLTNIKTPVLGHTSVYRPLQRLILQCDGCNPSPNEIHEVHYLLGLAALIRKGPNLITVFTTNLDDMCSGSLTNDDSSTKNSTRRPSVSNSETSSLSTCLSDASSSTLEKCLLHQQQLLMQQHPPNNPLFTSLATSARSKNVRLVPIPQGTPLGGTTVSDDSSDDSRSFAVDESSQFSLLDSALSYIYSPVECFILMFDIVVLAHELALLTEDCSVRVKACQTIMLIVSIPDEKAAEIIISDTLFISRISARLSDLYHQIPMIVEPSQIDEMHVSWGMDTPSGECSTKDGSRQLSEFFSWLDFFDQLMIESYPIIGEALAREVKERFLNEVLDVNALIQPLAITILTKCFKMASSKLFNDILCSWLLNSSNGAVTSGPIHSLSIEKALLDNWTSPRPDLVLETLRLFEVIFEKGHQQVLYSLILMYLNDGSYLKNSVLSESISCKEKTERILESFMSLVPMNVRSSENGGYEQYLAESQRQYSTVLANTLRAGASFKTEGITVKRDKFYEGPFLNTLFKSLANIPYQPYEVNLELTGLVSKLCLRPEVHLSRYLLENTAEEIVPEASSLISVLKDVVRTLVSSVTDKPQYQLTLKQTRARLIGDQSDESSSHLQDSWSSSFENIVVVEELCKELAAIAFIKFKHLIEES